MLSYRSINLSRSHLKCDSSILVTVAGSCKQTLNFFVCLHKLNHHHHHYYYYLYYYYHYYY